MEVKFRVLKYESTFVGYCLLFSTQRISMPMPYLGNLNHRLDIQAVQPEKVKAYFIHHLPS